MNAKWSIYGRSNSRIFLAGLLGLYEMLVGIRGLRGNWKGYSRGQTNNVPCEKRTMHSKILHPVKSRIAPLKSFYGRFKDDNCSFLILLCNEIATDKLYSHNSSHGQRNISHGSHFIQSSWNQNSVNWRRMRYLFFGFSISGEVMRLFIMIWSCIFVFSFACLKFMEILLIT